MPDPGQPPQGAGPQPQQGQPQQGGGGVVGLMQNVGEALDHIKVAMDQAKGATPDQKQMIDGICQAYGQFIDSIQGGGSDQDGDEGKGQGQTVPPEAAGNKNAVPSM